MKRVFCPKCDQMLTLSDERIKEAVTQNEGRLDVVCDMCGHQLRMRINTKRKSDDNDADKPLAMLTVVENAFGYKQQFPLLPGSWHIGRRNKDTVVDIPIVTGDPSMDRHHCIIRVEADENGGMRLFLQDNDSHVGTFLAGRLLDAGEWAPLSIGDVITLGATSLIISPITA